MSATTCAPVVVFAYRRPEHLARCLHSLSQNPEAAESPVIIYCDGAKSEDDAHAVEATRGVAREAHGFATVQVIERAYNFGLSQSIVSGVTDQLRQRPEIIVVEDDLRMSPYFLRYMNDGLRHYVDVEHVASIHGYCYPLVKPLHAPFFVKGADCLGWATWQRSWSHYEPDSAFLLAELTRRHLRREFDFNGSYPYTRMLRAVSEGRTQSWAVRWYASTFLNDMLTLYPNESLVVHEGNDGTGTNFGRSSVLDTHLASKPVVLCEQDATESLRARREFQRYYRRARLRSAVDKIRAPRCRERP